MQLKDKNGSTRLSAKDMGVMAMPNYCPRCFWIKLHLDGELPFQIFPGIFNSIDAFSKHYIHAHLNEHHRLPDALASVANGTITSYHPKSWIEYRDPKTNVTLTGRSDDWLIARNGDLHLVDYKTARHTAGQDELQPLYDIQLNGYAWIGEQSKSHPATKTLTLIYFEPPETNNGDAGDPDNRTPHGVKMPFRTDPVPMTLDMDKIPSLLKQVRMLADMKNPPPVTPDCEDCRRIANLYAVLPPPPKGELELKLEQSIEWVRARKRREQRKGNA